LGLCLQALSAFLFIAFVGHLLHGKIDLYTLEGIQELGIKVAGTMIQNWLGLVGALCGHYFMSRWLGITAFLLLPPTYLAGHYLTYGKSYRRISLRQTTAWSLWSVLWLNTAMGYIAFVTGSVGNFGVLLGDMGLELGIVLDSLLGGGTWLLLATSLLIFLLYYDYSTDPFIQSETTQQASTLSLPTSEDADSVEDATIVTTQDTVNNPTTEPATDNTSSENVVAPQPTSVANIDSPQRTDGDTETNKHTVYDPTLDLSTYQRPTIELLDLHDQAIQSVGQEELTQNKEKIRETLNNFKIGISSIKATIGPTVTLYEIVPEAGIKISKIKNLEDDIALSLSALGIRIIAPIPGKGTIGIEVPNKHSQIVSLRSILAVEAFDKTDMELPIVMGKTIANETLIADLARMPHLLIAGATGQGKSVGINVVLASLLYKKHPAQLKLVLVDPKKVELSLYNKLERHFLAKLGSEDDPIITETKKVVHTLNSLCLEMDQRYELLKEAGVRNIKEYNTCFVQRKLNPKKGHRFLPYIVLVIDEFADMMMTAGKEVEAPIARLAQLARAIGIHLVLATQRPSVNVITGIIKANFPVRISYKVTSRIDSRTILDTGGAEQLVGRGDMLLAMNSEITRLQSPFVDTKEVAKICDYIGAQKGYTAGYVLPACEEEQEAQNDVPLGDKDALFGEAAHLVVAHQQGSTSLIQRKLKLGYNRAGRLIDQLEAAGIVGPFEGSKAREVLIPDTYSLEQILQGLGDNQ
jgi:S-DNA-T family DNA segregation ATPase FtsK/SpoIIIE